MWHQSERDAKWRGSEFVVSYPDTGDRGRMRGSSYYPPGTLHRPTCGLLSEGRRVGAMNPSNVYETTLDEFKELANQHGVGNKFRVCQRCCKDVVVSGRNMEKRPEKKPHAFILRVSINAPSKNAAFEQLQRWLDRVHDNLDWTINVE